MWRAAIRPRDARSRPARWNQVIDLAAQVAHHAGWRHVVTHADRSAGGGPGVAWLLIDAPGRVDLMAVDAYDRLSPNRGELAMALDRLHWAGPSIVLLRSSTGRRLAKLVANLALAGLRGGATR